MAEIAKLDAHDDALLRSYRDHLAAAPPRDAGMNPSDTAHENAARWYADWARIEHAYRVLLAPRLLEAALARLAEATS